MKTRTRKSSQLFTRDESPTMALKALLPIEKKSLLRLFQEHLKTPPLQTFRTSLELSLIGCLNGKSEVSIYKPLGRSRRPKNAHKTPPQETFNGRLLYSPLMGCFYPSSSYLHPKEMVQFIGMFLFPPAEVSQKQATFIKLT